MYEELVKRLRDAAKMSEALAVLLPHSEGNAVAKLHRDAADAIEELQATLCNWCAVCPEDKRDLSTCEIYESCRAKPPKEE